MGRGSVGPEMVGRRRELEMELVLVPFRTDEQGNEIIMAARAHWFEDEQPAQEDAHAESGR